MPCPGYCEAVYTGVLRDLLALTLDTRPGSSDLATAGSEADAEQEQQVWERKEVASNGNHMEKDEKLELLSSWHP